VLRECLQWEFSELVGTPEPHVNEPSTVAGLNSSRSSGSDSDDDLEGLLGGLGVSSSPVGGGGAAAGGAKRGQRGLSFEALLDDLVVLSFLVSRRGSESCCGREGATSLGYSHCNVIAQ
jgi:hypothetical protein